jgi:hypothetical protein
LLQSGNLAKEGGNASMRKMGVEVPDDVFRKLRLYAVEHDVTIKEVVAEALRKHLEMKGGNETEKK